jgi:hypothetical protein
LVVKLLIGLNQTVAGSNKTVFQHSLKAGYANFSIASQLAGARTTFSLSEFLPFEGTRTIDHFSWSA